MRLQTFPRTVILAWYMGSINGVLGTPEDNQYIHGLMWQAIKAHPQGFTNEAPSVEVLKNNEGYGPEIAYRSFDFDGIIVNGLVIRESYPSPESFYRDAVLFYKMEVLKGPGSFLVVAEGFRDFERAMKKKLLKEIVPGPVSLDSTRTKSKITKKFK